MLLAGGLRPWEMERFTPAELIALADEVEQAMQKTRKRGTQA